MSQFVMLLWETPATFANASPAEIQAIIGEYVAWRKSMGAAGKLKGGQKLRDEGGKHLTGKTVADGPYIETNEIIGGFFLIEAADYAEAVAISSSCPHLKFGRIELREIEVT